MKTPLLNRKLSDTIRIKVRFSEVDSMGVVWHGNYFKYIEDGREALGLLHGLTYLQVYENGFVTPIVKSQIEHKSTVRYGEEVEIYSELIDCRAAKIIHRYRITNITTGRLAALAESVQVFTDTQGILQLYPPLFYSQWKESVKWEDR